MRHVQGIRKNLDLQQVAEFQGTSHYARHYSSLLRLSLRDGVTTLPDLATSWKFSPGADELTLTLRQGVRFHDGKPLTMEDVLFTFNRILSPPPGVAFPRLAGLRTAKKVEALDDWTLKFTLAAPNVDFLLEVASIWAFILPKHIAQLEGGINSPDRIIGTGPFKVKKVDIDSFVTSERYPDYYLIAPDGKPYPYLDQVTSVVIAEPEAVEGALRTGQVDIAGYAGLPLSNATNLVKTLGDKVVLGISPFPGMTRISLNGEKAPWNDLRARRAMYLAVDRLAIAQFLQVSGLPKMYEAVTFMSLPYPFTNEVPKYYGYDPATRKEAVAEAKRLFQEVGIKEIELLTPGELAVTRETAQLIVQQLQDIGMKASIKLTDWATWRGLGLAGDFTVALEGGALHSWNPVAVLDLFYLGGWRYHSALPPDKLTALVTKVRATQPGAERDQLLKEVDRIMREEWVPSVPIMTETGDPVVKWWYVRNYDTIPSGRFNAVQFIDVWLEEGAPKR